MEIKCEFNDGWDYKCSVNSAEITKRNTEITFVGNHLSGKTNEDVETIVFFNTKVVCFPRGLGKIFPNLKEVVIDSCGLKGLTKQDLIGLEGLTGLWLPYNHLKSLRPDLLKDMRNLTSVSFSSNKLRFVDSRMFDHIKHQLVTLDLSNNPCINASYDHLCYSGRPKNPTQAIAEVLEIIDEKLPNSKVWYNFQEIFFENLKQLWSSKCFSDFIIIVDKKEFKVHKNVLGIQSPVFAAMFENDMEESVSGKVTIHDFSAGAVEEFLQFLYTGEFPDETNAVEIFELASKYDVKVLKVEMEETIEMNVDSENAIEILKLGNIYESEILKAEAFIHVKLTYPELELPDHMKNKPENIEKLIEERQHNDLALVATTF